MQFLPRSLAARPRVALEIRPGAVIAAARAAAGPTTTLQEVSRADLPPGAIEPRSKGPNLLDPAAVTAAVRQTLDTVCGKGSERSRHVSLILPDTSLRVLLLDFDDLPAKPTEALPVVRFRLKKLLPFDPDHAVVSYQIMSTARGLIRVLAVAIPCDILAEYESVVTSAGFLPGAVLPSTLAAIAGIDPLTPGTLLVNVDADTVTTAIVDRSVLLLHRTVDLRSDDLSPNLSPPALASLTQPETATDFPTYEDSVVTAVNRTIAVDPDATSREIAQGVSVAAAYFEDNLGIPPASVRSAGALSPQQLQWTLENHGLGPIAVRDLFDPGNLAPGAQTTRIEHSWLAGVYGALST